MARTIAPCLRALLDRFIDYAGMFPPAGLSCEVALANYKRYRKGEHAWILGRLVIPAGELEHVPPVGSCSFDEPVQGLRALGLL
jgi:hypothetical protein